MCYTIIMIISYGNIMDIWMECGNKVRAILGLNDFVFADHCKHLDQRSYSFAAIKFRTSYFHTRAHSVNLNGDLFDRICVLLHTYTTNIKWYTLHEQFIKDYTFIILTANGSRVYPRRRSKWGFFVYSIYPR
jgi:hypothetical protein